MKRLSLIGIIMALLCLSCSKNDVNPKYYFFESALVLDQGPIETDGCGWHVVAFHDFGGQTNFIPTNLPTQFLVDSLLVTVSYTRTGDSIACGFANVKFPSMEIDSIR